MIPKAVKPYQNNKIILITLNFSHQSLTKKNC